jgi:hypothetical protein
MFLTADGSTGLPGTLLFSGSGAPITSRTSLGAGYVQAYFGLPSVTLGPGSYYFAVQAISSEFRTYLAEGTLTSGSAETHDGGASWGQLYEGLPSVAVSLSDSGVPEPASWALLLTGLAVLGPALRRAR